MAVTTMGAAGDGVRGDVRVTVKTGPPSLTIQSSIAAMYGPQIQSQAESVIRAYGSPQVEVLIEDSGALPFVLEARLESALASHLQSDLPPLPPRNGAGPSLRRSRLYVPGGMPKMFPGAGLYQPDVLILDLEDSVRLEDKVGARALVRRALHTLDWGNCERAVRINSGELGVEDVNVLAGQGVDLFLLPKCESAAQVHELEAQLEGLQSPAEILPIIESALGIAQSLEIAGSSPRVRSVAIGLEDYLTDIRAERTADGRESWFAMGQVLNSARAAGIQPLASVYSKVDDEPGLRQYVNAARAMGFEGIGCIHPRQIRPVHKSFRPSDSEIRRAQSIVDSFKASERGVIAVEGQMVDAPVYDRAISILKRAEVDR